MTVLRRAVTACLLLGVSLISSGRPTVHRMDASTATAAIEGVWYIPSLDACATIGPDMRMRIAGPYGALMSDPAGYRIRSYGAGNYTVDLPAAIDTRRHNRPATIELRLSADATTLEFLSPRSGWHINLLYLLAPRIGRGVRHDTNRKQPTPAAIRPAAGFTTPVSL